MNVGLVAVRGKKTIYNKKALFKEKELSEKIFNFIHVR